MNFLTLSGKPELGVDPCLGGLSLRSEISDPCLVCLSFGVDPCLVSLSLRSDPCLEPELRSDISDSCLESLSLGSEISDLCRKALC